MCGQHKTNQAGERERNQPQKLASIYIARVYVYRLRQCWYSAAAARAIAEEAPDSVDSEEKEEPLATSTLERRLHAAPAIQFAGENRRGGFNKAREVGKPGR